MSLREKTQQMLELPAYGLDRAGKSALYDQNLTLCTFHHARQSRAYAAFLKALGMQKTGRRTQMIREEDIPFLPVSIFKEMELKSIPDEEVFKVITSSGTSGQRPSRIFLDAQTSALQQKVLARIVAEEIGDRRLPCLILDTNAVLRDRRHFSARGAGILGFSMFASRICYALDENMQLNLEEIRAFIETHRQKALAKGESPRFLLYGFTFMIWQYFIRALEEQETSLELASSVLIHGGGWKKLQAQAVSPEEFAARIRAVTGIETVRSYYGMAEQTGCICMECACGHLHTSTWSDVIVRREKDYSVCETGEPGILQVLTPIAMSYPGHSLLTEDRGVLLGEDDCPCGRKGKYFKVLGRLPRAEIRGCSDTFEDAGQTNGQSNGKSTDPSNADNSKTGSKKDPAGQKQGVNIGDVTTERIRGEKRSEENSFSGKAAQEDDVSIPEDVKLIAGVRNPVREAWKPFAPEVIDFLDALSRALRQDSRVRRDPEAMALAFWCRRAHILSLRGKHRMEGQNPDADRIEGERENKKRGDQEGGTQIPGAAELRLGRGRIFHLAPANVPMMFAYTWILGLLAGNAGIVRISERTLRLESVQAVLAVIRRMFAQEESPEASALRTDRQGAGQGLSDREGFEPTEGFSDSFARICMRTSFITYSHSDAVTEQILRGCDGRVLWGGDETIRQMRGIPMPTHAVELAFPDRVSLAVIDEKALEAMSEEDFRNMVHRFYNDTYTMDQNGCSSPQTVVWLKADQEGEGRRNRNCRWNGDSRQDDDAARDEESLQDPAVLDVRERWWEALAVEAESFYENGGFRAARKLEKAALAAMRPPASEDLKIKILRHQGNILYVLSLSGMPEDLAACRGGFGLFFETEADSAEQIFRSFSRRIQTVVCIGTDPQKLAVRAAENHSEGALRFVEVGQALQIETVWDGIDLIRALSRKIQ